MTKEYLKQAIDIMMERATEEQLDLVWRFLRGMQEG